MTKDSLGTRNCRKILLATDGSEQSLDVVRYVGSTFSPQSTQIVLFNVGTEFPEVFWDMDDNPLYRSKKPKVMRWLANHQVAMGEFIEIALKILMDAGYPDDAVEVKTQAKRTGILADIVRESYQNYSAMVLGQTGTSRIKDAIFGSLANRLVGKIKHIPMVIVGGQPTSDKMMIAMDESIETMRVVSSIADLAGGGNQKIILSHALRLPGMFRFTSGQLPFTERELDWIEYQKNKFRPYMDEAAQRLQQGNVSPEDISRNFVATKRNPILKIIKTARKKDCGTLAVGRREAVSFGEAYFRGRFSEKIIKMLENMAVWIVN